MILTNINTISRSKVIYMDLILKLQMVRKYTLDKLKGMFDAKLT